MSPLPPKITPLPFTQLAILMIVRLAEPIQYTVIFPFVNQQVDEMNIAENPDRVGYYSGLIEAIFAGVQFFTVYHWAKLSDRWGRKPVIMMGLGGVAISGALYGYSTKFWHLIVTRSLSGALNGNVAVVRAAVSEITDDSNAPEGGYLSHPVERYPWLFTPGGLLERHPYLLPCLTTTSITLCGLIFTWLFLKETHEGVLYERSKRLRHTRPDSSSYAQLSSTDEQNHHLLSTRKSEADDNDHDFDENEDDDTRTLVGECDRDPSSPTFKSPRSQSFSREKEEELAKWAEMDRLREEEGKKEWGVREVFGEKAVRRMLASLFLLSFVGGGWQALILLYSYTPTFTGGLGLSPGIIGTILAIQGLWSIVCQLAFLSKIQRKWGSIRAFQILNTGFILVFLTLPLIRSVVVAAEGEHAGEHGESRSPWTWAALLIWLGLSTYIGMSNSISMVIVQLACPSRAALGAINGISTAVQCLSRVIGPSLVSAVFALSIDQHLLNGHLWWIFMVIVCIISAFVGLLLQDKVVPSPGAYEEGLGDEYGEGGGDMEMGELDDEIRRLQEHREGAGARGSGKVGLGIEGEGREGMKVGKALATGNDGGHEPENGEGRKRENA